jgi:hypothetical protein
MVLDKKVMIWLPLNLSQLKQEFLVLKKKCCLAMLMKKKKCCLAMFMQLPPAMMMSPGGCTACENL